MERERARLRAKMKFAREKQDAAETAGKSRALQDAAIGLAKFASARSVALYMAIHGEADTGRLLRAALEMGKTVFLPRVLPERQMEFAQLTSMAELAAGPLGILQPAANIPGHGAANFHPDLMFMPGLAFDRAGNRLGYGGGYYDRFLGKRGERAWPLVGLAYNFQILPAVPARPWDVKVDYICDEGGCYAVKGEG